MPRPLSDISGWLRAHPGTLRTLVAFVTLLFLYGPTLTLPFSWDDAPHFYIATTVSFADLWRGTQSYGWYRPAIFSLYKLLFAYLTVDAIWIARVVVLSVHAVSCGLLGAVADRLWRNLEPTDAPRGNQAAWLATALGVIDPFAVLPLPHLGTAMHVFVGLGLLAATDRLLAALQYGRPRDLVCAVLCAWITPYFHEAGTMAGVAAALVGVIWLGRGWRLHWRQLILVAVAGLAFAPVWLIAGRGAAGQHLIPNVFNLIEIPARVGYFLQPATYPLQFLAARLHYGLGLFEDLALWIGVAGAIGVWWFVLGGRRAMRLASLAFSTSFVLGLPSIMSLAVGYIIISQRLLYVPGLLSTVLWAHLAVHLLRRQAGPIWSSTIRGLVALGLGVVPLIYVAREVRLHVQALTPLAETIAAARATPESRHLVVNPVTWLTYRERPFPLGHDGVVVGADYLTLAQLIEANTHQAIRVDGVEFADLLPDLTDRFLAVENPSTPGRDALGLAASLSEYDRVWLVQWTSSNQNRTVFAGSVHPVSAQPPATYLAYFAPGLYLTAARVSRPGLEVEVQLDWILTGAPPDGEIFRHLLDCNGGLLANGTGAALEGLAPLWAIHAPSEILDVRRLAIAKPGAMTCFHIGVGLFRPSDGSRLAALRADGSAWPDGVVVLTP